jgi:hypothetical protein
MVANLPAMGMTAQQQIEIRMCGLTIDFWGMGQQHREAVVGECQMPPSQSYRPGSNGRH